MNGHQENWGAIPFDTTITIILCNRCGRAYQPPGGPLRMMRGDRLTILFPCCPDGGAQLIEWESLVEANA